MKTNYKKFGGVILALTILLVSFWTVAATAYNKGTEQSADQLKETELFLQEAVETIDGNRKTIQALNNQLDGYTKVYNNYIVVESDTGNLYIFAKDEKKGTPEAYTVTDEKTNEDSLRIVLE